MQTKATKATKANETKAAAAPSPKADKQADKQALAARIATERKAASDTFAQLSAAVSVPIKTLSAFKRSYKRDIAPHAIGRKPSPRQAAALYVALVASGGKLSDGATFPRQFTLRGASYAIENGALSDALASGLATYDSASETIKLANASEIKSQLGKAITGFKA